jgi:hypothetical protein
LTHGFTLKQTINEGFFTSKNSQRESHVEFQHVKACRKNGNLTASNASLVKQAPNKVIATKSPKNQKSNQTSKKPG